RVGGRGVDGESREGLLAALASAALSVRYMAIAKLDKMEQEEAWSVLKPAATQKENVWLRARALWQIGRRERTGAPKENAPGYRFLRSIAVKDQDDRFRQLAVRILKDCYGVPPQGYAKDASIAVCREALLGLRDVDPSLAKGEIWELAKRYDGKARFSLAAIGIAVGQDKARRDILLADFEKQFPDWNDRVANLVWELRPARVMPFLEKRLLDPTLPALQR